MRFTELLESIKAYHGSGNEHQAFDTKHTGQNSHTFGDYESQRHGIFFSLNPKFAALYGNVIEYELNISNTIGLDSNKKIMHDFYNVEGLDWEAQATTERALEKSVVWPMFEEETGEAFIKYLKEQGYDSAMFTEWNENEAGEEIEGKTVVVFNPSKVIKHGQLELNLYENSMDTRGFEAYIKDKYDVKPKLTEELTEKIINENMDLDCDYYMEEGCGIWAVAHALKNKGEVALLSNPDGEAWDGYDYEFTHVVSIINGKAYDCEGSYQHVTELNNRFGKLSIIGTYKPNIFLKNFMDDDDSKPLYGTKEDVLGIIGEIGEI